MAEAPDRPHYDKPFPDHETSRPKHGERLRDIVPPRPYDEHDDDREVDVPPTRTGDMDRPEMEPDE